MKPLPALIAAAIGLFGCADLSQPPPSCPDAPGTGVTSNAVHDSTRGAKDVSTTSNGVGSTVDPTAPPCR